MQDYNNNKNHESLSLPLICPGSIVKLVKCDKDTPLWKGRLGAQFRVGYYSEQDGFDVIWLVNENGEYCETIDKESLEKYFQTEYLSNETDFLGHDRPPFKAL